MASRAAAASAVAAAASSATSKAAPLPAVAHQTRVASLVGHLAPFPTSSQQEQGGAASSTSTAKTFTPQTLAKFNGASTDLVYIAIKGKVLDVTQGKAF